VEDVAHAASPPMGLGFSVVWPSLGIGSSSSAGDEDAPKVGLDTTVDLLSQLDHAPNVTQPL
jgi:hypothetical protein